MQLAFHLGRTANLAEQELLSVAPILPFPWTRSSVSGEFVMLKPTGDEVGDTAQQMVAMRDFAELLQDRLGGTQRIVWIDREVSRAELPDAMVGLALKAKEWLVPAARSVGVSIWGPIEAGPFGLKLKRHLKDDGWACRVVLPQEGNTLGSAVLAGQRLATVPRNAMPHGIELVAIADGERWHIGVTLTAANIDFYSERDFGIPAPDPVSGMLPPKLAQMMINLAAGPEKVHVHDPFCGNGRIVLEAALMGLPITGSDIEEEKVLATRENLEWLAGIAAFKQEPDQIWQGDATETKTRDHIIAATNGKPYVLVGEPYLGKPLRSPLQTTEQAAWLTELVHLYQAYLTAWAEVAHQPKCHLLVVPRAKVQDGSEAAVMNALVDTISRFGYDANIVSCYDRPDSIVRRDIVMFRKSQ